MILIAYGTRPEYLKIKPILVELDSLKVKYKLARICQHKETLEPSPDEADIIIPIKERKNSNRLDSIVKSVMDNPTLWSYKKIKAVLVQGDTTTAFAVALGAFHRQIPIIHVEAGYRSYAPQHPFPEEMNRRCISHMASYHFCPTDDAAIALIREGGNHPSRIAITGNTSLDNLLDIKENTETKRHIVITLHRRENIPVIREWFKKIVALATLRPDLSFIFPMHPNPAIKMHKDMFDDVDNIIVVSPLEHKKMKELLRTCYFVISDSGGIAEECAFLQKYCIVCRQITERGKSSYEILCRTPTALIKTFSAVTDKIASANMQLDKSIMEVCPYGDGFAGKKIASVIYSLNKKGFSLNNVYEKIPTGGDPKV